MGEGTFSVGGMRMHVTCSDGWPDDADLRQGGHGEALAASVPAYALEVGREPASPAAAVEALV